MNTGDIIGIVVIAGLGYYIYNSSNDSGSSSLASKIGQGIGKGAGAVVNEAKNQVPIIGG